MKVIYDLTIPEESSCSNDVIYPSDYIHDSIHSSFSSEEKDINKLHGVPEEVDKRYSDVWSNDLSDSNASDVSIYNLITDSPEGTPTEKASISNRKRPLPEEVPNPVAPTAPRSNKMTIFQFPEFRSKKKIDENNKSSNKWELYYHEQNLLKKLSSSVEHQKDTLTSKYTSKTIRSLNKKTNVNQFYDHVTLLMSSLDKDSQKLLDRFFDINVLVEQIELLSEYKIFCWKKKISKKWHPSEKVWLPCETHDLLHDVFLVSLNMDEVLTIMTSHKDKFLHHYYTLKNLITVSLIKPSKIVYLIEGLNKYKSQIYKKVAPSNNLDKINIIYDVEDSLVDLQIDAGNEICVNFTPNLTATFEYLLDFTKQMSLLEENLIYQNTINGHGFESKPSSGSTYSESWSKMLEIIPGISHLKARAILKKYNTISSLHKAYKLCTSDTETQGLLTNVQVPSHQINTLKPFSNLGIQISKKISACFLSETPQLLFTS